ncbi:MAG: DNA-binding protein [Legionellales bacterium]|nr:DNA-binding protein [Legionellales bacterium]
MKKYEFTLVLSGVDENTDDLEDCLFEAGCDDALINFRNGTVYLDFIREEKSLELAILSAIKQIETMPLAAKVTSVAPENLVSESEIAKRLKLKKQAVSLWSKGLRRNRPRFPHPVMKLSDTSPLWRWHEVVAWSLKNQIVNDPAMLDEAILIESLNLVLEERSAPAKELRESLLAKLRKL